MKWLDEEVKWYRPSLEMARRKMSLSWDRSSVLRELKGWVEKGESKYSEARGFFVVELTSPLPPRGNGNSNRMSGMTLVGDEEGDSKV